MKAIAVIDVQNGFLKPDYAELPARIRTHLEATSYDHVLFGKFVNTEDSSFTKVLGQKRLYGPPETDIVPELAPLAHPERTFARCAYSLFKSSEFVAHLEKHHIRTLALCGLVADSCVLATAFDGFDKGYGIIVLSDLMRTKPKLEGPAEAIFRRNFGSLGAGRGEGTL